ncbi:MAG: two pore domain potassium channel family protein [Eubacterium sp.]|nr:two pore domain potassium channel family protein [Eubacterium sp.]
MGKLKTLWKVIRHLNFDRVIVGFLIWFFISSAIISVVEPEINGIWNGMWYLFVACTSIGFGDMVAVTFIGRMLTVIMTILEILLVAMFSGVVVSFYLEIVRARERDGFTEFMDKLEHVTDLTAEELKEIEEKVKKIRS